MFVRRHSMVFGFVAAGQSRYKVRYDALCTGIGALTAKYKEGSMRKKAPEMDASSREGPISGALPVYELL